MSDTPSSADRIREKKKLFLAREQKIIDAALELLDRAGLVRYGRAAPPRSAPSP